MKKKTGIAIILILLALAAGAAFYFLYFVRTPVYALNEARVALKEHDAAKFQRYVDLDSVMGNAFEDIIKAESKINNTDIFSNPFALGILHMLKPSVVELMKQEAVDKIAAKKEEEQRPADPVPDAMKRNMQRHIPLSKLKLKDLQLSQQEGGETNADLVLHNTDLDKDFIAKLEMQKHEDGSWQIIKIKNLPELIVQFSAAEKAKLAAANKPIIERLNQSVQTSDVTLHIFQDSLSKNPKAKNVLTAITSVKNLTAVTINRMYYDVTLTDESGKDIYSYPEHFRGAIEPGQTRELNTSKSLNELLPDDKKLIGTELSKLKARIQVTYIAFDDGNVLSPNTFMQ
jgi:hypothetical protein